MEKTWAALAATVAAVSLAGMWWYAVGRAPGSDDIFAECRTGQVGGGAIGGPFSLIDKDGNKVTEKEALAAPTLVYFGYTFCPDVCPLDMDYNAQAADILEESGHQVNLVFITVDPARDSPEVVGEFAANVHPRALGLTGSDQEIADAAKSYRAYYKKQDGDPDFYLVDHSAFTYLMLPGHGFVEFLKHEALPEERANIAACYLDAAAREN